MATYTTPGVYIEEVSLLPASVAPVATAIPAFIGRTQIALDGQKKAITKPFRITSMPEYVRFFGEGASENAVLTVAITDDGTDVATAVRTITVTEDNTKVSGKYMYYALQMYFANGGGPCYIVTIGDYNDGGGFDFDTAVSNAIKSLEKQDEPTMIVFTDKPATNYKTAYDAALAQAQKLKDRVVLMDIWGETGNSFNDAKAFRDNHVSSNNLSYGMCYYPFLQTTLKYTVDESALTVTHTKAHSGTSYNGNTLAAIKTANPNLYSQLIAKIKEKTITVPPTPAIAGIYARVDNQRGVWKAPANESVLSIVGPTIKVTAEEQGVLNVDATSGKSINVVRTFTGKGTLVWGARTLAGNDNEWRYVNVRRFYNFAEESIKKASEFVVFEPNDANTWVRVKTMIENFLTTLWRQGALQGAVPADAFFVNVGIGVTMTSLDILEGRLNIEIGMAVVRPAEFIILKFSHLLQKS